MNEYEEDWTQFAANKYAVMAARDPLSPKAMKNHPSQDQVIRRFSKLEEEVAGAMVTPSDDGVKKGCLRELRGEYEVGPLTPCLLEEAMWAVGEG